MTQPSSFQHVVITTTGGQRADYFFAYRIGSFPTNVNIYATKGTTVDDTANYLRSRNGKKVKKIGTLQVMGRQMPLTRAVFHGLASTWVEEQVSLVADGYTWRLTASYEPRFKKKLRTTLLRMLSSFHAH